MKRLYQALAGSLIALCFIFILAPRALAAASFVTTDDVNFRKTASLDGEVIKVLYTSSRVEVLEHDPAGWSKVKADGATGYIRSDFLAVPKDSGSVEFVTTDIVNFRTGPSTDATVISTVNFGARVEVLEHDPAGWSKVKFGGETGYIRSDFLACQGVGVTQQQGAGSQTGASSGSTVGSSTGSSSSSAASGASSAASSQGAAASSAPRVYKTTDGVNFREGPSTDSGIIRAIVSGTSVEVLEYNQAGWSKVKYEGAIGYIKSEFLRSAVEYLEWSAAKDVVKIGMVIPVIDVRTGVRYNIKCFSKSGHADVEPLTKADTEAMLATRNGVWSWAARPVWVIINERTLAAALIGQPHDVSTISDNGMNGHICLHFAGTVTNSKSYQADIRKAVEESWNAR